MGEAFANELVDSEVLLDHALSTVRDGSISIPETEDDPEVYLAHLVEKFESMTDTALLCFVDKRENGWQLAEMMSLARTGRIAEFNLSYSNGDNRLIVSVAPKNPMRHFSLTVSMKNSTGAQPPALKN